MTPLPTNLREAWLPVALSRQLKARPIARMAAGIPIVLFRGAGGIGALRDRCPHRNHPLSLGRVRNGALQCPYHGWRFSSDGACIETPGIALDPACAGPLGAEPVGVAERHGAIFVRIAGDDGAFALPPLIGDPGHDHFWWAQGRWRGRALDAIENVLDPFHTNFIHDGFIRRAERRMPVRMRVKARERGIEVAIEQDKPDYGIMSRALESGGRTGSVTRYDPPATIQACWEGAERLTLCVTAFFTPEAPGWFRPFACFTTPKGLAPAWLKQAAIRTFLAPVVRQDRIALERQLATIERFGGPRFVQGPGDVLGPRVARLWAGEPIAPAEEGPFEVEL